MKIEKNIEKLISLTKDEKITWERLNPSTYVWRKQSSNGTNVNTVVQDRNIKKGDSDILFRLWNYDEKYAILDIEENNSSDKLKKLLQELYTVISGKLIINSDNLLSDLLRDL